MSNEFKPDDWFGNTLGSRLDKVSPEDAAIIESLESELRDLGARIRELGERLAAGEGGVREELNPAIRRERALGSKLYELRVRLGLDVDVPVMYGPPWKVSE